ncbi:MAG: imidazole glycerol phosphate synthase subunit HisH [Gammaproteobacteria bacterium]
MASIALIDYGMSNLRSVAKALEHVGGRVRICQSPSEIRGADRLVFPGQGAIGDCMRRLRSLGLDQALREAMGTKPFLGICLGLQSLLTESEEGGGTAGLGLIPGKVVRFAEGTLDPRTQGRFKIPHMGWNQVKQQKSHPLWTGIEQDARFYFVHSYYVKPEDRSLVAATTDYIQDFACALAHDNLFAVQFHPEKSQRPGLRLLANFIQWDGEDKLPSTL